MRDHVSYLTPQEAGDLAGYTARHIHNFIKSGKLTATREDNKFYIDKSEFFRVFPDAYKKFEKRNELKLSEEEVRIRHEVENKFLKEAIIEKEKQNEFLKQQLENFSQEKSQMLQAITSQSRLLEHQTKSKPDGDDSSGAWKGLFKFSKKPNKPLE